jgi:hypothetical protein
MTLLENPADNPCFGCGPSHARGLHLRFERRAIPGEPDGGEEVACTYTPKADEIGWPGLFHTGLHFTVLFETSYWAALTLGGKVHVAHGEQRFAQQRLPRVGLPFVARARVLEQGPAGLRIEAVSETVEGKAIGRLDTAWRTESRARIEKSGLKLPSYLLDEMEP